MKKVVVLALVLAGTSLLACDKDKKPEAAPPPVTPTATVAVPTPHASASAAAASPSAEAGAQALLADCPNAVTGAKTDIKDTKAGVEMTITAAGKADDIRARAKLAMADANSASPEHKHDGSGEGKGGSGKCPVVLRRTKVTVTDVENGAKIAVDAKDAKEADWLRREVKMRQSDLASPGGAEAGQGHMTHCPSAVQGAKTATKETKDGVDVTVTAATADGTKEIRERAKFLVEASKKDPTSVTHTGSGGGGGALGRCPVVLKDTTLEVKEVPGGATITVKPAKPEGLAPLKTEIKERVGHFT